MKAVIIQRASENVRRIETNYAIWMLSVASIVLFILTVDSITITDLEPYGFYYFRTLPPFYWAGIATAVAAAIISVVHDSRRSNDYRIIPVLLLALFIYGTPAFTYEVPRFVDIFAHLAEALPVISDGQIDQSDRYSREYPTTFVLLAISNIVLNIDPLTLARFIELFTALIVVSLIYCISKVSNSRYAVIAPLAFMSVFWVDQGHFSPQGLALILYLVFFFSLVKSISSPRNRRAWLVIGMAMLFAVNFTSPTNSLFLILNLLTIGAMSFIVFRKRNPVSNRMLVFIALAGAVFLSWSIYNAESRTILKAEEFEQRLADDFGTGDIKLTPSPSESYQVVNTMRMLVVGFVIVSGTIMSVILLRGKRTLYGAIMIGWFATATFIVVSMYLSPVVLSRNFMYVSISWAIVTALFLSHRIAGKKDKVAKWAVMAVVFALIVSIPATRYGRDPTTYASASIVNSAETLVDGSVGGERIISYFVGSLVTKYFAAENGIRTETLSFDRVFQENYLNDTTDKTVDWLESKSIVDSRVIFSDPERNNIVMKYNAPGLYDELEKSVEEDHNLVISNGATRVYSSTATSESEPQ